jgi:hypothetical protein
VDACPEFVPRGKIKTGRRGLRRKNAAKPAAGKEGKMPYIKANTVTPPGEIKGVEALFVPGGSARTAGDTPKEDLTSAKEAERLRALDGLEALKYDEPIMPPDERVHGIPAVKRRRYLAVIEEIIDAAVSYPPLCAETAEKLCAALSAMLVDGFLDEVYGTGESGIVGTEEPER